MHFSAPSLIIGIVSGAVAGASIATALPARYYIQGPPHGYTWIDRFTGEVRSCDYKEFTPVKYTTDPRLMHKLTILLHKNTSDLFMTTLYKAASVISSLC
jgi:hypothetical protein